MSTSLMILAKAPELGQVKTRLATGCDAATALAVYQQLLERTAFVAAIWPGPVTVMYAGSLTRMQQCALGAFSLAPQVAGGLGTRICQAGTSGLQQAERCVIIGTDCPALSVDALQAIDAGLDHHAVSFGPSEDGGYWCLGITPAAPLDLITDDQLPWSQSHVLTATQAILSARDVSWHSGPVLRDCDTMDDYRAAQQAGFLT